MVKVRKAVIPAAGLGTRFLPATKAQPKEMLPLVDKPSIQYVIEEAVGAGIEDILIVTGRGKQAIEDHFDRSVELENLLTGKGDEDKLEMVRHISDMANVHYIRQKAPLGLGHAVSVAEQHVGNEPFAVLLGDDVIDEGEKLLSDLVTRFERHGSSVIAAMEVERSQIKAYGCVAPADEIEPGLFRIADIVEKPTPEEAPSTLAVIGRYVLHPEIFDALRVTQPGAGGEIQLSDALKHLVQASERGVLAYAFTGTRYDAGDKNDYLRATVELAARRDDIGPAFVAFLRRFIAELDRRP
ncbi:MAG TPA: UTP--glucose-1-phosphate uridylyltransferase GalU [Actinomycetes bacterium]|nr:UTP--glucose-1-phosphate uridylyltransferase GalU [Actinomycetes bacterium]